MLYHNGTLCAEDRAQRHLARTTVNAALRSFESKTALLVETVINQLQPRTAAHCTVEQLLEVICAHPQLTAETATLERYRAAYPELSDTAARQHAHTLTRARQRLHEALRPHHTARRFSCAKGYRAA